MENHLFAQFPLETANSNIIQSSFTQLGAEAWGAGGAFIARKGLATAAFLNPAGLETDGFSVYVESGKRLRADYFGLDVDNQFFLPSYAN